MQMWLYKLVYILAVFKEVFKIIYFVSTPQKTYKIMLLMICI